jgi:Xaa-Pro aminopeptidase
MSSVAQEAPRMDYPAQRRQRLAQSLHDEGLDALLLTNPVNVTYLTGFTGEASYLVLGRDRTVLVSDFRFTEQLDSECPGLETFIRPPGQPIHAAAAEVLGKLGHRSVGIESSHLTVAALEALCSKAPTITWKGGSDRVERLRAVKDPSEVGEIREAIAIAERAFAVFRALLRPEDREKELADALEAFVRRAGGRCGSFPSIVAVGPRSALPHAPPTDKAVGEADFLLVDWGATGRLYKSDLTRVLVTRKNATFAQAGQARPPDAKLEVVYAVVLRAQERALQAIRPGVTGQAIDAVARGVIAEAGHGDHFGHGLGHGIGLEVHEAPAVRPGSEAVLEAGMVITVEPGIYLPGWGGVRIEDDVLVTPDGCEVLTTLTRDLRLLTCDF